MHYKASMTIKSKPARAVAPNSKVDLPDTRLTLVLRAVPCRPRIQTAPGETFYEYTPVDNGRDLDSDFHGRRERGSCPRPEPCAGAACRCTRAARDRGHRHSRWHPHVGYPDAGHCCHNRATLQPLSK